VKSGVFAVIVYDAPVVIGKVLTHYEIVAKLGAGGMGEVYRAQDKRLGRSVAVKVLPEIFAQNAERVARFEREAKLLASLNHGNIGSLFGFEQEGGQHFLVMEMIEGETLAERIARGSIGAEEVLRIAQQIAEAVEYAHEKGVIHRDLKPANVKITPEGKVKVLDFGLAKAMENHPGNANLSHSPTMMSMAATHQGVILGTAAYMSPEQAKGFDADARSDVFSFGCMLYEMFSSRQAFNGETVADVLAGVLAREPDLGALPPNLNPRITDLLRRCIEKNPKRRWHAMADVRVEIETIVADPRGSTIQVFPQTIEIQPPLWKRAIPVVFGVVLSALITGVAVWKLKAVPAPTVTRFAFSAEGTLFTALSRHSVSIAPNGSAFVYVANNRLYLRPMKDASSVLIQGTELPLGVANPAFSPDSQWLVFYAGVDRTLKRISVGGGAPVTVGKLEAVPFGISWGPDNQLLVGLGNRGIVRIPANGGKAETIITVKQEELAHGPQLLPGGDVVLFTLAQVQGSDRWNKAQIVAQSLKTGERKVLIDGGSDARYLPDGRLIYGLSSTLLVVPFDVKRLSIRGGPVPVVEGVLGASAAATGAYHFSISDNGALIYISGRVGNNAAQYALQLVDRNGSPKPLNLPAAPYNAPRISPNGKQVAFSTDDGKEAIVWIYDLDGKTSSRRLTFGGRNVNPVWSADSRLIFFQSDREGDQGLFSQRADGTGIAERVTKPDGGWNGHIADAWGPNQILVFSAYKPGDASLWTYSEGDRKATLFADATGQQQKGTMSPDGRWLAYQSDEINSAGSPDIYVQPFPPNGTKFQITKNGGNNPIWAPNGKELFFNKNATSQLYSVDVQTQPAFTFGNPVELPVKDFLQVPGVSRQFDVTPDGKQFIVVMPPGSTGNGTSQQIQVVIGWFEELKQRTSPH
jgi:serine/threonine-protein kinase